MARKKFVIEYDFEKVPLSLLWQFLYTNSGLETWYADEVTNDGKNYTIVWDDEPHDALLLSAAEFIGHFIALILHTDSLEHLLDTFLDLRLGLPAGGFEHEP